MENELKKIDILKERANVTYEEAREALLETDGNLVEALIKLEKEDRIRPKKKQQQERTERKERPHHEEKQARKQHRKEEMRDAGDKLSNHRFILYKDGKTLLDLPTWVALLIILFTMPFSLVALVFAIIVGFQMQIRSYTGKEYSVDQPIRDVAQQVKDEIDRDKDDDEADQ